MLYSLLLGLALLASPMQWCGGGRMCCIPQRTKVVPQPQPQARPLTIFVPSILRIDRYPQPVRIGLALIVPPPYDALLIGSIVNDDQR